MKARPKIEDGHKIPYPVRVDRYCDKLEQEIAELKKSNKLMNEYVRLLPDEFYHEYLEKLNKH